jgi:hypothetical protein
MSGPLEFGWRWAEQFRANPEPVRSAAYLREQLDLALGEARRLEGDERVWPTAPLSKRLNDLLRWVRAR